MHKRNSKLNWYDVTYLGLDYGVVDSYFGSLPASSFLQGLKDNGMWDVGHIFIKVFVRNICFIICKLYLHFCIKRFNVKRREGKSDLEKLHLIKFCNMFVCHSSSTIHLENNIVRPRNLRLLQGRYCVGRIEFLVPSSDI